VLSWSSGARIGKAYRYRVFAVAGLDAQAWVFVPKDGLSYGIGTALRPSSFEANTTLSIDRRERGFHRG